MGNMNHSIIQKVRDFAQQQNLFNVENIIVGVSGGPDSIALVTILKELAFENSKFPKLYAVHINHGIRKEDADRDQIFVEEYCRKIGLEVKSFIYDVPSEAKRMGRSLEETGRILRYQAFDEFAQDLFGDDFEKVSRIAVAHHQDDVAETMLMNLFRGCGLDGLVSPRPVNGRVIRPLLCISKKDILDYLDDNHIEYMHDYTNDEVDCTRNIWRNNIIPAINEASNKTATDALNSTYTLLNDDYDYIENVVDSIYKDNVVCEEGICLLPCEVIKKNHKAVAGRLIRKLRKDNCSNLINYSSLHLDLVYNMVMESSMETRTLDMPFNTLAFVASGFLGFCKDEEELSSACCVIAQQMGFLAIFDPISIKIDANEGNPTKIPNSRLLIEVQKFENIDGLEYNEQSWFIPFFKGETSIITIANGLSRIKFTKAGSSSGKVLSKVMADLHIPRHARDSIVGIQYGEDYLWVPGIGHTNGFVSRKSYEAWSRASAHPDGFIKIAIKNGVNN